VRVEGLPKLQAIHTSKLQSPSAVVGVKVSGSPEAGRAALRTPEIAHTSLKEPGAATDPPDRARMMLTGWGVNVNFTPMKSLFQAVP
jgi:hypothetical protein